MFVCVYLFVSFCVHVYVWPVGMCMLASLCVYVLGLVCVCACIYACVLYVFMCCACMCVRVCLCFMYVYMCSCICGCVNEVTVFHVFYYISVYTDIRYYSSLIITDIPVLGGNDTL